MNADRTSRHAIQCRRFFLLSVFISFHLWFFTGFALAQEGARDVVANLAAGRVVIGVAEGGIVIGVTGAPAPNAEPGSHPPLVVPLGGRRVAVLLGAVEWISPAGGRPPVRLDRELASLVSQSMRPRLGAESERNASDIETLGVAMLEQLRAVTVDLHSKLDFKPDEPLLDLILADYLEGYGAEVWLLRYRVAQDALRGEYWRTRVLRPSYTQLYPPEKGQPRTLMEVRYPPDDPTPALLELLRGNDPRLVKLGAGDPHTARAIQAIVRGESHKAPVKDLADLLHGALDATLAANTKLVLGVLQEQRGFEWILAPPEPPQKAQEGKPREPGAPTLKKPP